MAKFNNDDNDNIHNQIYIIMNIVAIIIIVKKCYWQINWHLFGANIVLPVR